ncbi:MAG: hypothetical protein KIT83_21860, partial [Bryobacterales bacterium]|nr:hypothetical protein [Bryobacterales bacterium]
GEPGNILDHIRNLQNQLQQGRPLDKQQYEKVFNVYKNQKQGKIIMPSQIPTQSQLTRDVFNDTLKNTASEFVTGTKSDGSTSWLGIGGRALTGFVTAGASEVVLVPANAAITMKDYVDKGGDSSLEAFKNAMGTVAKDLVIGKASGAVIGGAVRGVGALGSAAGEMIKQAAKNGSSVAKTLVNAAQGAGRAATAISKAARTPIGAKPPSLGTVAKAPKVVTPDGAQWVRNVNRAGSTGVKTVPAGIPASKVPTGFTTLQVKHVQMVSQKYGVKIDVRPTNPHAEAWIKSGKGVPKPEFLKTKTLTPMDQLLGAKGAPGQVGYYRPKLPPKGTMSDAGYDELKKLYIQRVKEFRGERGAINKAVGSEKAFVKDGVVYNGKPPDGKPFVGDMDVMDIRDPVSGRPLPRYQVDHKGNIMMDPMTGQPKLNPVREAIMKDLGRGPCQTQHGTHMDWKYDANRPPLGTPPDPQAAAKFAHDQKIDTGVMNKHRPGGEPLVSYGPEGFTEAVYIEGGR